MRNCPLCFLLLAVCLLPGARLAAQPKGIEIKPFTGWSDSLHLEASGARAVIVPAVGGRILHYSIDGENVIWENRDAAGQTLGNSRGDFWLGGYQLDLGPEIRGIPEHEVLWKGVYQWRTPRDYTVRVMSERDQGTGVQLEKEIVIEPGSGDLGITQLMRNISSEPVSYCLWDRTLCKGGGFALVPLNKKSHFRKGWAVRRTVDERFIYDGVNPSSPNVRVMKGVLVARCEGPATKIGADSDAGWVAYVFGRTLFVKYFPYDATGNYSDGGNSVAVYFDERVAELGPLSPEVQLQPNETYEFPEKWTLIELPREVLTFEQARKLVRDIPPSPFRRK
jgi:hypothetical protein